MDLRKNLSEINDCLIVQVRNRSAATLLAAIVENIADGSIIYFDSWRAYKTTDLEKAGFQHFKVNHRYNFIDADTGIHTRTRPAPLIFAVTAQSCYSENELSWSGPSPHSEYRTFMGISKVEERSDTILRPTCPSSCGGPNYPLESAHSTPSCRPSSRSCHPNNRMIVCYLEK